MELEFKTEEEIMEFFRERHGYLTVHRICELLVTHNNVQAAEIEIIKEHLHNLKNGNFLLIQQEGEDIYQEKFAGTPDRVKRYFSSPAVNTSEEEVVQKSTWWKKPEIIIPIIIGVIGLLIAVISIPWWLQWFERDHQNIEAVRPTLVGPLTINSLANAQIPNFATQEDEFITLKNGEYNFTAWVAEMSDPEYDVPGYVMLLSTTSSYAYSDFNNDGMNDVVATFEANNGGTGRWKLLTVFLNNEGFPEFSTAYYLGDRVSVESVTASGTDLFVDIITQGPGEGRCYGTTPLSLHLSVYGNSIELISEEWGESETPTQESE